MLGMRESDGAAPEGEGERERARRLRETKRGLEGASPEGDRELGFQLCSAYIYCEAVTGPRWAWCASHD